MAPPPHRWRRQRCDCCWAAEVAESRRCCSSTERPARLLFDPACTSNWSAREEIAQTCVLTPRRVSRGITPHFHLSKPGVAFCTARDALKSTILRSLSTTLLPCASPTKALSQKPSRSRQERRKRRAALCVVVLDRPPARLLEAGCPSARRTAG